MKLCLNITCNIFVVKNWRTKYSTHSAKRFLLHCEYIRFFPKGLRPYLAHLSSSFIMYWKMIEETRRRKRHFTRRRWKQQKKTGACWSMKNWFGFMIYNHVWLYYCIRLKQLRNFLIFTVYHISSQSFYAIEINIIWTNIGTYLLQAPQPDKT